MPYITKQYKFCAAHRYWNSEWSNEENEKIFGKDIYIHGHNYILNITISGPISPETGFIINLADLNIIIDQNIIKLIDHKQIEEDIDWFKSIQPSTENMVVFMWNQICDKIKNPAKLHSIKLQETPTIYTEYFGPGEDIDKK